MSAENRQADNRMAPNPNPNPNTYGLVQRSRLG